MNVPTQQIHYLGLWVCLAIGVVVIAAMFYTMFAHRRSTNVTRAALADSTFVEFIWTLIPVLILVAMVIPATTGLRDTGNNKSAENSESGEMYLRP